MKQILTTIAILFAVTTQAQIDTVKNAIQVQPVVVNALQKDTCFQVSWTVFGLNRNDTTGANSYVQLYSRTGKRVAELNVPIPYSVLKVWLDDSVIDDYILTYLGLYRR